MPCRVETGSVGLEGSMRAKTQSHEHRKKLLFEASPHLLAQQVVVRVRKFAGCDWHAADQQAGSPKHNLQKERAWASAGAVTAKGWAVAARNGLREELA